MSDFVLDFRRQPDASRIMDQAIHALTFCAGTHTEVITTDAFSLALTRVDDYELWGPCKSPNRDLMVALTGRIALDDRDWCKAEAREGDGGLACKAILGMYQSSGIQALERLNGNYVVLIHDAPLNRFFIVTDRCGAFPCFSNSRVHKGLVFSSHPDVLASVVGEQDKLDPVSMAEFLMTGRITPPNTYFDGIHALDMGSIYTVELGRGVPSSVSARKYFSFNFSIDPQATEWDLAEQLGDALKKAVRRRTLRRFGVSGLALSGGLDSRTILCAAEPRDNIRAFSLFDAENTEYRTAQAIASACGVELIPVRRNFDYYGDSAESGVKISGGTGCIASNHFLGIREQLRDAEMSNLLTGCYCDYLFKALPSNKRVRRLSRLEAFAPFHHEFYRPCFWLDTTYARDVMCRLDAAIPHELRASTSDESLLQIEALRTFPLSYEADLTQRIIPQRVMPWYIPIVDNDIVNVYLKIPPKQKLNSSMYAKMVELTCGPKVCAIPNSNSGAPVNAGPLSLCLHTYMTALTNRIEQKMIPRMTLSGSWPNWEYYIHHSHKVDDLWWRHPGHAKDFFAQTLGLNPYQKSIQEYRGRNVELFLRLLTLKLWLDQRA